MTYEKVVRSHAFVSLFFTFTIYQLITVLTYTYQEGVHKQQMSKIMTEKLIRKVPQILKHCIERQTYYKMFKYWRVHLARCLKHTVFWLNQ